jgi:hypothetical protein
MILFLRREKDKIKAEIFILGDLYFEALFFAKTVKCGWSPATSRVSISAKNFWKKNKQTPSHTNS